MKLKQKEINLIEDYFQKAYFEATWFKIIQQSFPNTFLIYIVNYSFHLKFLK